MRQHGTCPTRIILTSALSLLLPITAACPLLCSWFIPWSQHLSLGYTSVHLLKMFCMQLLKEEKNVNNSSGV